jgi:serine/threonine protein kinase
MGFALPPQIFKRRFISLGASGWVFQIDQYTAVKFAKTTASSELARESAIFDIFDIFENHEPSPHVIQSFLRVSDAIFLPFLSGGSLEDRLHGNQIRDRGKFVRVVRIEPVELIEQWTIEIAAGSAWIDCLGYVHGDLRPPNLLLDADCHIKLADFGWADKIGTPATGNGPPWARLSGSEAGEEKGT